MFQYLRDGQKVKGFVKNILECFKMKYLFENDIIMLQKCKCGLRDSNLLLHEVYSNYAIHIILGEIMKIVCF